MLDFDEIELCSIKNEISRMQIIGGIQFYSACKRLKILDAQFLGCLSRVLRAFALLMHGYEAELTATYSFVS